MIYFIGRRVFYKPGLHGGVYPSLLTSRVRGQEIAEYMGGKFIKDGTIDTGGLRIHLKPRILDHVKDGEYVDILDEPLLIPLLKQRPKIKVIAYNKPYYDFLKKELENEIFLIPHHHINFENTKRTRNINIVGGLVGKSNTASYDIFNPIKEVLGKVGINFKECFTYETRQDILNFYSGVDFQVIWFPNQTKEYNSFYRHSTKIANAASFGIPTIAQNIIGHQDFDGDYLEAGSYKDIAKEAEKLKDKSLYDELSERLIERAEEYHISKIAELYRKLK